MGDALLKAFPISLHFDTVSLHGEPAFLWHHFGHNPLSDFPKSSVESYEFISGAQQVEAQDAAGTGGLSPGGDPRIGHQFRPAEKGAFPSSLSAVGFDESCVECALWS